MCSPVSRNNKQAKPLRSKGIPALISRLLLDWVAFILNNWLELVNFNFCFAQPLALEGMLAASCHVPIMGRGVTATKQLV